MIYGRPLHLLTWKGSRDSAYSMARQASLFVKKTKSSLLVSLFLTRGEYARDIEQVSYRYQIPDDCVHGLDLRLAGQEVDRGRKRLCLPPLTIQELGSVVKTTLHTKRISLTRANGVWEMQAPA